MSDETETKIVITHKGSGATVGIQRTDCDPILFIAPGDLLVVLGNIPRLLDEAGKRWQTNPRYPKAELPTPTPPAAAVHQASSSQARPPNKPQEAMF